MKLTPKIQNRTATKRPISPTGDDSNKREHKWQLIDHTPVNIDMAKNSTNQNNQEPTTLEENAVLTNTLGPLISEFKLLQESVDTVHQDYADLKRTISKQKDEIKVELSDKIDQNTTQLNRISKEKSSTKKGWTVLNSHNYLIM